MNRVAGPTLTLVLFLTLLMPVSAARGFTVRTQPVDSSLAGESIELELKVISGGVGQEPTTPLGPTRGRVGDTLDMGTLRDVPQRPTELRVTLPWGTYYRNVPGSALREGSLSLRVYPEGSGEYSIQEHGMLVQPFPGRVMLREYLVVNNPTRTLVGGSADPLTLDLPGEVSSVHPGPGLSGEDDLVPREGRYEYRLKFPPGRSIIGFYYMIRADSDDYTLRRDVSRSTRRFSVAMPRYPNLDVRVQGLRKTSGSDTAGNLRYEGRDLSPGDRFSITLDGLDDVNPAGAAGRGPGGTTSPGGSPPGSSAGDDSRPSSTSMLSWPLVLGISVSLLFFVGAYAYVQYARARLGQNTVEASFLIEEIARLDQEHEDGAVGDAYHNRTRRRWKNKLTESTDHEPAED